jgi:hypothetical protein
MQALRDPTLSDGSRIYPYDRRVSPLTLGLSDFHISFWIRSIRERIFKTIKRKMFSCFVAHCDAYDMPVLSSSRPDYVIVARSLDSKITFCSAAKTVAFSFAST